LPTRLLLDGPDIETLLTRVQEEHGSAARIVHAERVRSRGLAGFFAKERFEVSVEVDEQTVADVESAYDDALPAALQVAQELDGPVDPAPSEVSTGGTAFADVLGSITSSLGTSRPDAPTGSDSFVPAPRPEVLPATRAYGGLARTVPSAAAPAPARSYPPAVTRSPAPTRAPARAAVRPPRPPRTAGAILAVVGEGRLAYETARDLARTMRVDPADVLLAAPEPLVAKLPASRRLGTAPAARTRAGKLMSAPQPSVVVVDYPIGADPTWSAEVLDALGATAVWALVDATRKIADLNRWTRGLRHIDALVVHNAAASDDPGSVKALGLPVALLDGRVATEAAWRAADPYRDWA
jgi:hypothetical protein